MHMEHKLNEFQESTDLLLKLLHDRQPSLMTWRSMMFERLTEQRTLIEQTLAGRGQ